MNNIIQNNLQINKGLILIDIQEKIINPINNKDSIIKNIKKLLRAYELLDENIFVSEQNPLKLGETVTDLLPKVDFNKIQKVEFSLAKNYELIEELENKKVTNLIICGIETHICIQQSVIEFMEKGYEVFVISDAMGSRNKLDHDTALQRMLHKGAIITTTESIIFELCETSDRKEFKEISKIIKN